MLRGPCRNIHMLVDKRRYSRHLLTDCNSCRLQKVEGDINSLLAAVDQRGQHRRALGASGMTDWELVLTGAAAGAGLCCTGLWLAWRLRYLQRA